MVKIQPSVRPARQDIVAVAREQVLGRGEPLTEAQLVEVLQTPGPVGVAEHLRAGRGGQAQVTPDHWAARCIAHGATTVSTWTGG